MPFLEEGTFYGDTLTVSSQKESGLPGGCRAKRRRRESEFSGVTLAGHRPLGASEPLHVNSVQFSWVETASPSRHTLGTGGSISATGTEAHRATGAVHPSPHPGISRESPHRCSFCGLSLYLSVGTAPGKCNAGRGQPQIPPPEGGVELCTPVTPEVGSPPEGARRLGWGRNHRS